MSTNVRIELLSKDNYDTWKIQMRALLIKNDAWQYVSGITTKPEVVAGNAESIAAAALWETNDAKASSDIILCIDPKELKQVKNCSTSKEIWEKLKNSYQSTGPARKGTLLKQLALSRLENGGDVKEHVRNYFDIIDKLTEMDINIHNDMLAILLLYSLPASFENFRCAIESRDDLPTLDALRIKIIEENEARNNDSRLENSNALLARKNFYRKKTEKKDEGSSGNQTFKFKCHRCKKKGHKSNECTAKTQSNLAQDLCLYSVVDIAAEERAFGAISQSEASDWCLDSGCTSHLCKNKENFIEINEGPVGQLDLANNASTKIKAKGTVKVTFEINGKQTNIFLKDVLYVPDLRLNLLSIGKICDNGYKVVFEKNGVSMIHKELNTIIDGERRNGLYFLKNHQEKCNSTRENREKSRKMTELEEWHRKMGHLNVRDLKEGLKKGIIKGIKLNFQQEDFHCDVCTLGKLTRSPFPIRTEKASNVLETIHSDVWGPARVESMKKARYFVTFIDEKSGWCEIRFLKRKNEVFQEFKNFKILVENQTERKVKHLQSDNGREYVNTEFENFLKENGISRRLSVPHTPEQNGIAERRNRTLIEMARCLLIQSKLPLIFWAEAVNTANYIRNRCPSRNTEKTSFEIFTGKIPDVTNFQEFGSEVFVLNTDPTKNKLEAKSKKGIFLGYSEEAKGYRVWVDEDKRVIVSRDVKFPKRNNEELPRIEKKKITTEEEKKFVDFEIKPTVKEIMENLPDEDWFDAEDNSEGIQEELQEEVSEDELNHQLNPADDFPGDLRNEQNQPIQETKRGRGRPRIIRTGGPGRPKKVYHKQNEEANNDFVGLAEIPVHEALKGADRDEWLQAMATEMQSIIKNETWIIVDRPKNEKTISSRIILRNKYNADGSIEKRKARIVARGFSQRPGIDFDETFAPVARISSIRMATALAAEYQLKIKQFDIVTAYLNGILEEEIWMELPQFAEETLETLIGKELKNSEIKNRADKMLQEIQSGDKVCLMKKALYGLRQAGRRWHLRLSEEIKNFGLLSSEYDPCTFYAGRGEEIFMVIIYVDDILVLSRNDGKIKKFQDHLTKHFELKILGDVKYCLGIEFTKNQDVFSLNQKGYIIDILNRFNMAEANAVISPIDVSTKLMKGEKEDHKRSDFPYQELIGSLMYLSTCTRPDIAYVTSYLSQYNTNYNETHWNAAKRVLRYLKGTSDMGIHFKKTSKPLVGYVDADWANCLDDRRSYTGYVFILAGCPISWESRKQRTVALSSTEAEYMALTEATKEAMYLRRFLMELGFESLTDLQLFCDNNGALKLAKNPVYHSRTKHIDVKHHFVREALETDDHLRISYIPTTEMTADILTKGLPGSNHRKCIKLLGLI
uniref:Retrovirus-related Pol polyprotein from transposon TNT 1-94 n=1 Tax=Bracon brevicornis TaxID=1563983 RepID=A0A6V7IJ77_9HYME